MKRLKNKIRYWWALRQLKKVAEPATEKKLIRTDKSGNKFYTLKNSATLPTERCLTSIVYTEDTKWGLTLEKRAHGFKLMRELINEEGAVQRDKLGEIMGALEMAATLYAEPETILNLASVFVVMNNESFDTYAAYEQQLKRQMWDKDPESKSFFLQLGYRYSVKYSQQPELNVPSYLKKIKPALDQINWSLGWPTNETSS